MSSNGAAGGRREEATSTMSAALCLAMLSELKLITVRSVLLEGNNAKGEKQRDKSQN